jgi:hypothetical protein
MDMEVQVLHLAMADRWAAKEAEMMARAAMKRDLNMETLLVGVGADEKLIGLHMIAQNVLSVNTKKGLHRALKFIS